MHATPYQMLAVAPFTEWLATSHPEIRDPYPLVGGVSHWLPQRPILEDLADEFRGGDWLYQRSPVELDEEVDEAEEVEEVEHEDEEEA